LRLAFDGVVSPDVLKEILAGRLHPGSGGERRDICVLFSDIRNFTPLSEHLPPEIVTDFLNRYFEHMTATIHRHGGTLHKFIGDGIMAVFGAPRTGDDSCGDAFRCAKEMLTEVKIFNQEQEARAGPLIAIGVGLHFGPALVGYIGSAERHEYSAVGDTVNAASRLEGLTKEVGYPIVISAAVRERLTELDRIDSLGAHPVKGHAPIAVFGWTP
jgi:adenylate cyclase